MLAVYQIDFYKFMQCACELIMAYDIVIRNKLLDFEDYSRGEFQVNPSGKLVPF